MPVVPATPLAPSRRHMGWRRWRGRFEPGLWRGDRRVFRFRVLLTGRGKNTALCQCEYHQSKNKYAFHPVSVDFRSPTSERDESELCKNLVCTIRDLARISISARQSLG